MEGEILCPERNDLHYWLNFEIINIHLIYDILIF